MKAGKKRLSFGFISGSHRGKGPQLPTYQNDKRTARGPSAAYIPLLPSEHRSLLCCTQAVVVRRAKRLPQPLPPAPLTTPSSPAATSPPRILLPLISLPLLSALVFRAQKPASAAHPSVSIPSFHHASLFHPRLGLVRWTCCGRGGVALARGGRSCNYRLWCVTCGVLYETHVLMILSQRRTPRRTSPSGAKRRTRTVTAPPSKKPFLKQMSSSSTLSTPRKK